MVASCIITHLMHHLYRTNTLISRAISNSYGVFRVKEFYTCKGILHVWDDPLHRPPSRTGDGACNGIPL